jgi:hypothetical protein
LELEAVQGCRRSKGLVVVESLHRPPAFRHHLQEVACAMSSSSTTRIISPLNRIRWREIEPLTACYLAFLRRGAKKSARLISPNRESSGRHLRERQEPHSGGLPQQCDRQGLVRPPKASKGAFGERHAMREIR